MSLLSIGGVEQPALAPGPHILPFPQQQLANAPPAFAETRPRAAAGAIRVLHLVNGEHYAGAERVQDLLAQQLPQFGCHVGFACVKAGRFSELRSSQHTPLAQLPMRSRLDFGSVRHVARLLRNEDYQLLHAHTPRTALIGSLAALLAKVPWIYHVHSPAGRDSTRLIQNWFNAAIERAVVRGAARLVAVSPSVRNYMIKCGIPAECIVYVPNGVPPVPDAAERRPPIGCWTLGAAALFRPRKGIEVLLQALALMNSRGVQVRLRAIGGFETPAYQAAVLALAERLDINKAIDWIGFTRDVNSELANVDLLVLPSLFGEGLPMVVLEAMAAGVPVVASHVEGVPEAVVHRETGLLVEPGSVSQLAQAVEQIVQGRVDYTAFSRSARQRHLALFSDTAMAEKIADVYRGVLAEHHRAG